MGKVVHQNAIVFLQIFKRTKLGNSPPILEEGIVKLRMQQC